MMKRIKRRLTFRYPGKFRQQLQLELTVAVVVLSLLMVLLTTLVVSHWTERKILDYALRVAEQSASNTVFAVLAQDPSLAQQSLLAITAFPDVEAAALFDHDFKILASSSESPQTLRVKPHPPTEQASMIAEDNAAWRLVAPIVARFEESAAMSLDVSNQPAAEVLGYVQIVWSKHLVVSLRSTVLLINGALALIIAIILGVVLRRRLRRLTDPLIHISNTMRGAMRGEKGSRAMINGPEETRTIAKVFNELAEVRDRQTEWLEIKVDERTNELRQARDEALQAVRTKSLFLANMSHEMRTPLHVIQGFADVVKTETVLIDDDYQAEKLAESAARIHYFAHRLHRQIETLLELAKADTDNLKMHLQTLDLEQFIEKLRWEIQYTIAENGNRLLVAKTGDACVRIDAEKLHHIVINLLTNAYKFTEQGQITLSIDNQPKQLTISVADSGMGIPKSQQDLIWQHFEQADMTEAKRFAGSGVGLALVKQLCSAMGGGVSLESDAGAGATFRVCIPLPCRDDLKPRC